MSVGSAKEPRSDSSSSPSAWLCPPSEGADTRRPATAGPPGSCGGSAPPPAPPPDGAVASFSGGMREGDEGSPLAAAAAVGAGLMFGRSESEREIPTSRGAPGSSSPTAALISRLVVERSCSTASCSAGS